MSTIIKKNLVSNFIGKFILACLSFVSIPYFIKYLGIDFYGLIGFYTTLAATLSFCDFGLSTTLIREISSWDQNQSSSENRSSVIALLELLFWGIGIVLTLFILALSSSIGSFWLHSETIAPDRISQTIILMGFAFCSQWPSSFYFGILTGLQRQTVQNTIQVVFFACKTIGSLLAIAYISSTIETFFFIQIITNLLQLLFLLWICGKIYPRNPFKVKWNWNEIKQIKNYAVGTFLINISTIFVSNLDKIILSKLFSLSNYGYYCLAASIANTTLLIAAPITSTYFPRLCEVFKQGNASLFKDNFHKSSQILSSLLIPYCLMFVFFSKQILSLWIHNPAVIKESHMLVSLLMSCALLNTLLHIPNIVQMAYGITKLPLLQNVFVAALLGPCIYLSTAYFGSIGAPISLIAIYLGRHFIFVPLLFAKILPNEQRSWWINDIGRPFFVSGVLCFAGYYWLNLEQIKVNMWVFLTIMGFVLVVSNMMVLRTLRASFLTLIKLRKFS